ncbi:MAG: NHL repeat-containing protein [Caldilineaceae bacterium]|nr:NHL repeat-containing protein [Caldilineaceae bacterium]
MTLPKFVAFAAAIIISTVLFLAPIPAFPITFFPSWDVVPPFVALAAPAAPPDAVADRVLGQTGFTSNGSGLTASTMNGPAGVALAPNDRLFVVDYGQNRVLSWPSAAAFTNGAAADLVLGQPDFTSMTGATSATNLSAPESVVVDSAGNVWVADSYNMRIVRFSPPFSNGMAANLVLGQSNFTDSDLNRGLATPDGIGLFFPRGLAFDSQGRLYVADMYNNRVLRFAPPFTNGQSADLVIGQANFVSGEPNRDGMGAKANGLRAPAAVLLDSNDHLYVADRDNNRVLRFDAPLSTGKTASAVFGQASFTAEPPWTENCQDNPENNAVPAIRADTLSEPLDLALNSAGELFVSDICYHRILVYQNPISGDQVADFVYGQANFTSGLRNRGSASPTANTLANPLGLAVSSSGMLYVADFENHRVLAYDMPAILPTATPTATPTTPPAATASPTATATPTTLPTATPTTTPTATSVTPATGDSYESDNLCTQAKSIATGGEIQARTFHVAGDTDWVRFDAVKDAHYLIEVTVSADSVADSVLELYPSCDGPLSDAQDHTFSPGIRLELVAPATGPLFLKLADHDPLQGGPNARYELSVRQLGVAAVADSALILVAGTIRTTDPLQPNIYYVTEAVRRLFLNQNYTDERIQYLAPDPSRANVDAAATVANLQNAITTWAPSKLSNNGVLTIYVMDHGEKERIYLNKAQNEIVTPTQIDQWLTQLEAARPGIKINIIIEACYSGSFISHPDSLSRAGRLVMTSTSDQKLAWASAAGAHFSDHLIDALGRKSSLYTSFQWAQGAAQAYHPEQVAWLDGNGNGIPNEPEDYALAAQRGFDIAGTLGELWPPFIREATGPTTITNGQGLLQAVVQDDKVVKHVWAVIYPPSYAPPSDGDALIRDEDDLSIARVKLDLRSDGSYRALYTGFQGDGVYRVVFYSEDDDGLQAQPITRLVTIAQPQLFLPLVTR